MANITAREKAYDSIREKIITLELKPGEKVSDKELAEEFEMSRTPVREALILLTVAKLVVVRPQSGTFVAPIDLEKAEEEQFARYALEKEMIRRSAEGMSEEQKLCYQENLRLYELYKNSRTLGEERKLLEIDNEFHCIAFRFNGKEKHFDRMMAQLHHMERIRILSLILIRDDHVYDDHLQLVDAMARGDVAAAEYWLEKHLNRYRLDIQQSRRMFPQYFSDKNG